MRVVGDDFALDLFCPSLGSNPCQPSVGGVSKAARPVTTGMPAPSPSRSRLAAATAVAPAAPGRGSRRSPALPQPENAVKDLYVEARVNRVMQLIRKISDHLTQRASGKLIRSRRTLLIGWTLRHSEARVGGWNGRDRPRERARQRSRLAGMAL